MTAVACFILGMGMTITAAYIFLATTMAPALIQEGMNAMAVHLFILYWASLSNVTPPVGLAVVAAAGVAGARLMPAMLESVRFAAVKYALPFFFVYNPVLLWMGAWPAVVQATATATIGVFSLSYGFDHAFSENERKILALLHLFQGFVDVDALRIMGQPEADWCLDAVRGLTRERSVPLLDRAAEIGLLTAHGNGYYSIHPALPWYFRDLFERDRVPAGDDGPGCFDALRPAARGFVRLDRAASFSIVAHHGHDSTFLTAAFLNAPPASASPPLAPRSGPRTRPGTPRARA